MGPQPAAAPADKKKIKKKRLPFEKLYVSALPKGTRYSKSLMHRDRVSFVTVTPHTDFIITSCVYHVKFWKKTVDGMEFVKDYNIGESAPVRSVSSSVDGRSFAAVGGLVNVFDVAAFDYMYAFELPEEQQPLSACWVHRKFSALPLLAVSAENSSAIFVYDTRSKPKEPLYVNRRLHKSPVSVMAYNDKFDCMISADVGGMIEYWQPTEDEPFKKPDSVFQYKSQTDLFEFKKNKSVPTCITISPNGDRFATFSLPDRKIRLFDFASGKLLRVYDESVAAARDAMQRHSGEQGQRNEGDVARRLALEETLGGNDKDPRLSQRNRINVIFDESGHFLLYGSASGIKLVNTFTNKLVKVFGGDETFRPLNLALYQGQPRKQEATNIAMGASNNALLQESEARDPTLIATGIDKHRFYVFTDEEKPEKRTRDIQNERPRDLTSGNGAKKQEEEHAHSTGPTSTAVLHTTMGDIFIRFFPEAAPKAVENFVTHAKAGYYNGLKFHRVIKKFMIQTGDPWGNGQGGQSIWGKPFEDEFTTLQHDQPYTVSMANAGPNTNGSQFFITTTKTVSFFATEASMMLLVRLQLTLCSQPWLDKKHTIFGRAIKGFDVIHNIENVPTDKDVPRQDIKILNIDIS